MQDVNHYRSKWNRWESRCAKWQLWRWRLGSYICVYDANAMHLKEYLYFLVKEVLKDQERPCNFFPVAIKHGMPIKLLDPIFFPSTKEIVVLTGHRIGHVASL